MLARRLPSRAVRRASAEIGLGPISPRLRAATKPSALLKARILEVLRGAEHPVDCETLLPLVRASGLQVSTASLYRHLRELVADGEVLESRVALRRLYLHAAKALSCRFEGPDGVVMEVNAPQLSALLTLVAAEMQLPLSSRVTIRFEADDDLPPRRDE